MRELHVVCHRPGGMIRAGVRHPRHKAHPLDAFTGAQLREMLDEPELAVFLGERVTEAHVVAMEAELAAKAAKAKKGEA